jgi:hypothetical protein
VEITFIRDKDRRKVKVTPDQPKEGELPTLFQTAPGANGDKQTFVIPSVPAAPAGVQQPATLPAMPALREIRRVI